MIDSNKTFEICSEIVEERGRQESMRLAGRFAKTCASEEMHDSEALAVLVEEVGEVARAVLERNRLAFDRHDKDLRKELIEVAAVCVAWIEKLDRQPVLPIEP